MLARIWTSGVWVCVWPSVGILNYWAALQHVPKRVATVNSCTAGISGVSCIPSESMCVCECVVRIYIWMRQEGFIMRQEMRCIPSILFLWGNYINVVRSFDYQNIVWFRKTATELYKYATIHAFIILSTPFLFLFWSKMSHICMFFRY